MTPYVEVEDIIIIDKPVKKTKYAFLNVANHKNVQILVDAGVLKTKCGAEIKVTYSRPRLSKIFFSFLTVNITDYFLKINRNEINFDYKSNRIKSLKGEILQLIEKLKVDKEITIDDIRSNKNEIKKNSTNYYYKKIGQCSKQTDDFKMHGIFFILKEIIKNCLN